MNLPARRPAFLPALLFFNDIVANYKTKKGIKGTFSCAERRFFP
jgi:hypothetical protein